MTLKFRAFVLPVLLFFSLSTVTAPARAVLPLIAAGVAFITEGSVAANGLAALTVGTVAGMIYLGNLQSGTGATDGSGSYMEIPLGTSRSRPMSTPPNYSVPANNDAQPMPPSNSAMLQGYASGAGNGYGWGTTPELACRALVDNLNQVYSGSDFFYVSNTVSVCTYRQSDLTYDSTVNISPSGKCPDGYAQVSGACSLSNATLVMKPADGRCHILMNVNGFVIDPQDPECGGLATNTGTTVTPTQIKQTKPGTLTNGTVTINPDGSRTIVYSHGNTTNNTTTTTTVNLNTTTGGNTIVTGNSVTTTAGTGSLAGTNPVAPAAPPITFPDDYNREATQSAIKTDVAEIKTALTTAPAAPNTLPGPSAAIDQAANDHKSAIEALAAAGANNHGFIWDWSPMIPTATCSPAVISAGGRSITLEWCPVVEKVRELSGYALYLVTAWSLFFILTARREN